MYLKGFIESLAILRRPEFFSSAAYLQYPAEAVFTLGYDEEKNETGDMVCKLHYCLRDECRIIKSVDITEQWQYMRQLKEEPIDLMNAIDPDDMETVFLEGVMIVDAITNYDYNVSFIDTAEWAGMTIIHAIVTNTDYSGEPVLPLFGNNVFLRDLVMEQMKFMVKRYIAASPLYHPEKAAADTRELFEEQFAKAVEKYHDVTWLSLDEMKSITVTGHRNQELDDFIEQIQYEHSDPSSDRAKSKRLVMAFQELFLKDSDFTEIVDTKQGYVVLSWTPSSEGGPDLLQTFPCESSDALLAKLLERYEAELVMRYTNFGTTSLADEKREEIDCEITELRSKFGK